MSFDDKPVSRFDIRRMAEALAHRGPDGFDIWTKAQVGLGYNALYTSSDSRKEPFISTSRCGSLVIVCDARIDNRKELIGLLDLEDKAQDGIGNGEIILAAYEQWGERCPEMLLGDFAFVIWDGRRELLFCCRDHFGVKPFHYCLTRDSFYCASEIKALMALDQIPVDLNQRMIAEHIVGAYQSREETCYRDIMRLPPGHRLTVDSRGARVEAYWRLDPNREIRMKSDREYAEAFRELFTEAVRCRLSDLPVGSTLSGGLDSSSIACVASSLLATNGGGPLVSFSAVFDDVRECDERHFIDCLLDRYPIEPNYVKGDQIGPLTDLNLMLWHEDKPVFGPNLFIHWGLFKAARERGIRVMLDGFDGDSVVSHGYQYLNELASERRWLRLVSETVMVSKRFKQSPWQPLSGYLRHYAINPAVSRSKSLRAIRYGWRALMRRSGRKSPEKSARHWAALINPDFIRRAGIEHRLKSFQKVQAESSSSERDGHYLTLTQHSLPLAFETLDCAAAAFSTEVRYPFWDKRLVEFCLALPPRQKIHRGWTRLVMRRAMEGILPREIQWREGKTDFMPAFRYALTRFDQARLEEVVSRQSRDIGEFINTLAMRERFDQIRSDDSVIGARELLSFWKAVSLALWLDIYWPARRRAKEVIVM